MANAIWNMTASTGAAEILRRAKSIARLPTSSSGVDYVGASTADRNSELVAIFNDKERELYDEFPILGRTRATNLTTTASQRHTLLQTTLHQNDIDRIEWGDVDDAEYEGKTIRQIGRAELDALPLEYKQDETTVEYPDYWYLSDIQYSTQIAIEWYPMPSAAKAITIYYRTGPRVYVANDLTGGSNYSSLPDKMINLLAHDIAIVFLERANKDHSSQQASRERLAQQWVGLLSKTPQQYRTATFGCEGYPDPEHRAESILGYDTGD